MPLWRRHRRRSLAPRRPAVFGEQWPLVAFTVLLLAGSAAAVAGVLVAR